MVILNVDIALLQQTVQSEPGGTFLNKLHDYIPGMDVDCNQRSQSDPCLFGEFPSHLLHNVIQLILELLVVFF